MKAYRAIKPNEFVVIHIPEKHLCLYSNCGKKLVNGMYWKIYMENPSFLKSFDETSIEMEEIQLSDQMAQNIETLYRLQEMDISSAKRECLFLLGLPIDCIRCHTQLIFDKKDKRHDLCDNCAKTCWSCHKPVGPNERRGGRCDVCQEYDDAMRC